MDYQNNDRHKVSILISTKNQGHFIGQTLRSILNQDHKYIEVMVTDAKSTDNTINILEKLNSSIFWQSETDDGEYDGYNKLLLKATGDYIKIVPSDDLILPNATSRCLKYLLENPEVDIVFGFSYVIDIHGHVLSVQGPQYRDRPFTLKNYLRGKVNHSFQTALFRRSVFDRVGKFNSEEFKYIGDFEFFARCLSKGLRVNYIKEYLGAWRLTFENQSRTRKKEIDKQLLGVVTRYGNFRDYSYRYLNDFILHRLIGYPKRMLGRIKWGILELFGYRRIDRYSDITLFNNY